MIGAVTAMICQPRFRCGMDLNAAGSEMEDFPVLVEQRRDDLLDTIERMPASSEFEQTRCLAVLLRFRSAEEMSRLELSDLTAGLLCLPILTRPRPSSGRSAVSTSIRVIAAAVAIG